MTNQERPIEEREESLNTSLDTTHVAVEEQEPPAQHDGTVQDGSADQSQADFNDEVGRTQAASTATERAASTPAPEVEAHPGVPKEAVQAAEAAATTSNEAGAAVPEQAIALGADVPAEPATAETNAQDMPAPEQEAHATGAPPAGDDKTSAETLASAGASYAPADDGSTGRPRRVKDLEPGMELEGRVTSIALYGIFVDIGVGRDGLVHISEMSDTRIESPSDVVQIGDTVKVRVKSVEPDGKRISLTMRSKDREARGAGQRGRKKPEINREALAMLRVGDTVEGTVTGIAPFGVFVDIGVGKDGLVHISELSEGRIEKAEDAVEVGQTYTFKLLEIDAEGTRISLSLRGAQRVQRMQQLEQGQILEGTVSGLAPFGAFVDIGVGRDGLVHISELSPERVNKVEDVVHVGDRVKVRVLGVDPQSKRISLSLRLEDQPREEPASGRAASSHAPAGARNEPRPRREESRSRREERGDRSVRGPSQALSRVEQPLDTGDAYEDVEEDVGNATLEDLLSKYGDSSRRDRRRRRDDDSDESGERNARRQREALRRTLQQMRDEE